VRAVEERRMLGPCSLDPGARGFRVDVERDRDDLDALRMELGS
jgi:hypothetical protein